jgi:hypothetical protein
MQVVESGSKVGQSERSSQALGVDRNTNQLQPLKSLHWAKQSSFVSDAVNTSGVPIHSPNENTSKSWCHCVTEFLLHQINTVQEIIILNLRQLTVSLLHLCIKIDVAYKFTHSSIGFLCLKIGKQTF